MIEKLIIEFFKAIEENESITSRHGKAVFFIEEILEKKYDKFNYVSIQTISRLQRKYIDKEENVPVGVPDSFIKDIMANYLNYQDYENFKMINSSSFWGKKKIHHTNKDHIPELNPKSTKNIQKTITKISITLVIPLFFLVNYKSYLFDKNECIIWESDHYEKVPCYQLNSINNSNKEIDIINFKKTIVTDTTTFFTKGIHNFWYGKNKEGKREFFTMRGIHPETKKELKPITRTILMKEGLLKE